MHARQTLQRKLTTARFDAKAGQIACWMVSAFVFIGGLLKLFSMQLPETQLFFGVFLVSAVGLLCLAIGILLPIAQFVEQQQRNDAT